MEMSRAQKIKNLRKLEIIMSQVYNLKKNKQKKVIKK